MKVCFLPSDFDAPGCYRCMFPARALREKGHDVRLPPFIEKDEEGGAKNRISFNLDLNPPKPWADIWVLQQRKERMWVEGGVSLLRRWGVASVAELDDNYLELPSYNPAWLGTHPYRRDDGTILNRKARRGFNQKIQPNPENRTHMTDMIKQCDALTVSTPYLANLYSFANPNIYVLRNMLDWDIWEDVQPQYEVERDRVRIGYLGVFSYRQGDLDVIKRVIPAFLRRHPEVDFVANSTSVHDYLGVPEDQRVWVEEYAFRPREGDYPVGAKTAVLDIGLVPLAMNGLNEAKSHLKGMEYNAAGIPFIATPTESYRDYWCDNGENGVLAEGDGEWLDALEFLVREDSTRRRMGKLGRLKASENTYQKKIHLWEDVYSDIIGDKEAQLARQSITVGAVQKVSEHAAMLREATGAKTIVEVGSARGGTFWSLARVAAPDATLVSIDIPAGSPIDMQNGKDVYLGRPTRERMKSYVLPGQRAVMIDADSQEETTVEALKLLVPEPIDVLFIDADHRYEGVKRDHELYSPLVKPGGLIFFHDIIPQNDHRSGVHKLWAELKRQYREWHEFIGEETWGIGSWAGIGMVVKDG